MSEGTIYQRGPEGQMPMGQSINGVADAYGNIDLNGNQTEHVTMYGDGWHRSWDNPNGTGDHSTHHATGSITQH
jgi:hypothetical protein